VSDALIIFVKNAELGKVKTRLAATLGAQKAFEIYDQLLRYTHSLALAVEAKRTVYYSSKLEKNDLWSGAFDKAVQKDGDLGQRMSAAFAHQLRIHDKVLIIGSDCAQLTSGIIAEAFEKLESYDLVIGPANDGGYYLLGMKSYHPIIFEGVSWSSEKVFQETITKIEQIRKSHLVLPQLIDVDDENDWNQVKDNFE